LSFKQNRNRTEKRHKKEQRREGLAILSSSGENIHYEKRSMQRSQSGGVVPFCSKKLIKMIRQGKAQIVGKDAGSKTIKLPSGEVIVTDRRIESVITFFGRK